MSTIPSRTVVTSTIMVIMAVAVMERNTRPSYEVAACVLMKDSAVVEDNVYYY